MTEELELDRLMSMSHEVQQTIGPIVEKRTKEGAGIMEITLGIADGIRRLLVAYSAWHNPKLNAEVVIKTATVWMLEGIKEDEESVNKIIDGLENGTLKLNK